MAKSTRPVIQELEDRFNHVYQGFYKNTYNAARQKFFKSYIHPPYQQLFSPFPQAPVISLNTTRRKNPVWYVPEAWQNKTNTAIAAIAGSTQGTQLGELNINPELLTTSEENIWKFLAFGAFIHLQAILRENRKTQNKLWLQTEVYNYETNYFYTRTSYQLGSWGISYKVNQDNKLEFEDITEDVKDVIATYVSNNPKAFETYRNTKSKTNQPYKAGSLRKWMCPKCRIPIRASRPLRLACQCGSMVEYADHDKMYFYRSISHTFDPPNPNDPGNKPTTQNISGAEWTSKEKCQKCDIALTITNYGYSSMNAYHKYPHQNPNYNQGPTTVQVERDF